MYCLYITLTRDVNGADRPRSADRGSRIGFNPRSVDPKRIEDRNVQCTTGVNFAYRHAMAEINAYS